MGGGEIDQIGHPCIFEDGLQHRIGDEDCSKAKADRPDHEGKAQGDARDMRQRTAEPETVSPEDSSMMLFGPGVMNITAAKMTKPIKSE